MDDLAGALEVRLRGHILAELPPDASGEVARLSFSDLLHVYGVRRDRLVPQRPRRVHVSKELRASGEGARLRGVLNALTEKIEAGEDVSPHLSERVRTPYVPATAIKEGKRHLREDRDGLLADWGIHHLHVSTEPGRGGVVKRTKELLFAIFRPDDAYLIGIYPHPEWAPIEALEIVVRNWPDADLMLGSLSGVRLNQTFTDEERLALRNAGTTGMVEIEGRVFMPRSQTTDGSPSDVVRREHALMRALADLRNGRAADRLADAERELNARHGEPPLPRWRPAILGDECGLLQESFFVGLAWLP